MFHIIKSMDMPTYVGLMLILIVMSIYYIIKYRRAKAPWIILMYSLAVNSIVLIKPSVYSNYIKSFGESQKRIYRCTVRRFLQLSQHFFGTCKYGFSQSYS